MTLGDDVAADVAWLLKFTCNVALREMRERVCEISEMKGIVFLTHESVTKELIYRLDRAYIQTG